MTNEEIAYQRFQRKLSKIIEGVASLRPQYVLDLHATAMGLANQCVAFRCLSYLF